MFGTMHCCLFRISSSIWFRSRNCHKTYAASQRQIRPIRATAAKINFLNEVDKINTQSFGYHAAALTT